VVRLHGALRSVDEWFLFNGHLCIPTGGEMTRASPIRVMLVDDHAMVRRGLAAFLLAFDDLQLVGEASSGQEAVRLCEQLEPDVILMDLVMPEMDGAAATRAIRERYPQIQVLALTSFKEKDLVQKALDAGAIGYLLKNISTAELADAIREAHAGRPTLAPEASQALALAEGLERMGRALLDAPPDASTLPAILREHVPAMFADSHIEIQHFAGERVLLRHPDGWLKDLTPVWNWLRAVPETHCLLPSTPMPWTDHRATDAAIVTAPIIDIETGQAIGGIYVSPYRNPEVVLAWTSAIESLAARIASTLHGAQVYAQTLAQQRVEQELALAGQIQASFLPEVLPGLPGWQIAAILEPARETSGDFYDFLALPGGQLGILIADVANKGMGAALYMALCRTLIRTYAAEHPTRPDLVLSATNRRLLMDARAGLFVTACYGVIDPASGMLAYCNAGHNPPLLLSALDGSPVRELRRTGMALGAVEDQVWRQSTVQIAPGDVLLLYTDGITEAQDPNGSFFGADRLLGSLQASLYSSAAEVPCAQRIQDALLAEIHAFVGNAPQFDDITLVVIARNAPSSTDNDREASRGE
jgi:serine phosphatase RsbU (regulator of sigma subunit)/DNA-binding NarL/FixJ family response regulator